MTDQLLASVLAEASLTSASHDAIARAYPTLDDLLSATLDEIADAGGSEEASRLWEALERRWRSEAVGTELGAPSGTSRLGQLVTAPSAQERPASLRSRGPPPAPPPAAPPPPPPPPAPPPQRRFAR